MVFKKLITSLFNIVLPRSKESAILGNISPENFIDKAKPCRKQPTDAIALFDYSDPLVKALIWDLKFRRRRFRAELIGNLMYETLLGELGESPQFRNIGKPLIIPVPLGREKRQDRGFNQCELIVEHMEKIDRGKNFSYVPKIIEKTHDTKVQSRTTDRDARAKNIAGCFSVKNPELVKGKTVIVIDDVITTGSTISEIKKILLVAGAKEVIGLAFAH